MGVYIKGMEMPKDIEPGLVIEFADGADGKRYARLYHYRYGGLTEWLETVPVPPHGRLIDGDVADRWISVEEPPEENGRYIVAYEDAVSILDFFNGGWYFPWRTSDGVAHEETGTLQAWRPFPEPPKEEQNERDQI